MNRVKSFLLISVVVVGVVLYSTNAYAIPTFSRKYNVGCNFCHTVYPRLNETGRNFKNNGYRTDDELEPSTKKQSFWEQGYGAMPLAIHGKINQEFAPKGNVKSATGLEELQLNAGINMSSKVSFYLHTHLWEEGEVGGPLVASVRINDLFGNRHFNLRAGQYELPLSFSPEVERLTAFRYLAFGQSVGGNSFNFEQPQLGVELNGELGNDFWYWAGIVNGSGFGFNEADEAFDNNSAKDPYFRLAKNFNDNTIGVFGYLGNNQVFTDSVNFNQKDRFLRVGGDVNWNFSKLNVRTTLLYGRDNNFDGLKNKTSFYGGFVEGNYNATDRLIFIGRYDMTKLADAEATTDEESGQTTWTVTPGFQFLILPNIKVGLEYQVRQKREQDRAIALLHFAL